MNEGQVLSWSHSKLIDFEKCRQLIWLKHVQRIPEPQKALPPGKTEHGNDRGHRIHSEIEAYVKGEVDVFPVEAKDFTAEMNKLRALYAAGKVSIEGEWGMDEDWAACDWKTAWLRLKLDALVFLSDYEAVPIDFKTGMIFGNEIKHGEQLNLYALCTFLRYPKLEVLHTELWYLDHNELTARTLTREKALQFKRSFNSRGTALTTATAFPPRPNKFSCKWCRYKHTEHCKVGV